MAAEVGSQEIWAALHLAETQLGQEVEPHSPWQEAALQHGEPAPPQHEVRFPFTHLL